MPYLKGISPKVNATARQDLKLANYDAAVQHVYHYITETQPRVREAWFEVIRVK